MAFAKIDGVTRHWSMSSERWKASSKLHSINYEYFMENILIPTVVKLGHVSNVYFSRCCIRPVEPVEQRSCASPGAENWGHVRLHKLHRLRPSTAECELWRQIIWPRSILHAYITTLLVVIFSDKSPRIRFVRYLNSMAVTEAEIVHISLKVRKQGLVYE